MSNATQNFIQEANLTTKNLILKIGLSSLGLILLSALAYFVKKKHEKSKNDAKRFEADLKEIEYNSKKIGDATDDFLKRIIPQDKHNLIKDINVEAEKKKFLYICGDYITIANFDFSDRSHFKTSDKNLEDLGIFIGKLEIYIEKINKNIKSVQSYKPDDSSLKKVRSIINENFMSRIKRIGCNNLEILNDVKDDNFQYSAYRTQLIDDSITFSDNSDFLVLTKKDIMNKKLLVKEAQEHLFNDSQKNIIKQGIEEGKKQANQLNTIITTESTSQATGQNLTDNLEQVAS